MSIQVVQGLPEEQWRHFVEHHPQGNIFHTPEMFEVFRAARGHKPELWAALKEGQVLALLLPVRVTLGDGLSRVPVARALTTRAVVYGSVLAAPGPGGQEALVQMLRTYVQAVGREVLFTELRNLADMEGMQPLLQSHAFAYEPYLNYLIDLGRSPEDIMQGIGRRTRKHIRRGLRREEVLVEEMKDAAEVMTSYELLRQTYKLAQVPLADRSLFDAAFEVLHPKNMVRFTAARVGQAMAAVSVELLYKDVVYGWYGGLDRDYGAYMPNELLMWHILAWGAAQGYQVYDFGGAGKPDEDYGVRDFKAKFGGELVGYGRNIYIHAPNLLRLSEWGYNVLRRWL